MSVEARVPHSTPAGGGESGGGGGKGWRRRTASQSSDDDRRQNSTEHEPRNTATGRVVRPQMTSQNGVITIGPDSDIPRCVDLRRAQSLRDTEGEARVRRERGQSKYKRHTVLFDLPDKKDDVAKDVANQNGRQGPKKPPRLRLQGHIEEDSEALKKGQQEEEEGEKKYDDDIDGQGSPGFNTVTLRRSLASGIARVRSFSGGKEVELARYNVEKRSSRGNNARGPYVQYKNTEGDWKRHSVRRTSQYEPCDHTFKVSYDETLNII